MAAHPRIFPATLFIFIVVFISHLSKAAIIPDRISSAAHGNSGEEEMTSHHLDLANLALPPEVITEALFSQTDLLQDQLEQCEEMVRDKLENDDAADSEGLEDEDDDQGDTLDRQIAQLAVDAFNHPGQEDSEDISDHEVSRKSGSDNDKDDDESTPVKGKDRAGDKKNEKEDKEEEYVVYEYEDVVADEHSGEKEDGDKSAESSEKGDPTTKDNNNNNNSNNNNASSQNTKPANPQTEYPGTTEDPADILQSKTTLIPEHLKSQYRQGSTTPIVESTENSGPESTMSSEERAPESVQGNSEEKSRPKRSLSINHVIQHDLTEGGVREDIHKISFGQGRIRRQASLKDITPWITKLSGVVGEEKKESSVEVLGEKLSSVLVHLHAGESGQPEKSEFSITQEALKALQQHSRTNPKQDMEVTELEFLDLENPRKNNLKVTDTTENLSQHTGKDSNPLIDDAIKMAEKSLKYDVIKMAENSPAQNVLEMARIFLQTYKNSLHYADSSRLRQSNVQGLRARVASRQRRSAEEGVSPERYVPLIDQLVERLNYLQHSVRVCHLLLPQGHHLLSSANSTAAAA